MKTACQQLLHFMSISEDDPLAKKFLQMEQEQMNDELEKCKQSPYYYATKYLQVNGKPFTTHLSEQEFNKYFNEVCRLNNKL